MVFYHCYGGSEYALQWNITLSNEHNWAGTLLGAGYGCSVSRGRKGQYTKAVIESFKWISEEDGTALPGLSSSDGDWSEDCDTAYVSALVSLKPVRRIGVVELHNPTNKDFYLTYKKTGAETADKYIRAKE